MAFPLTQTRHHDGQAAPARTASILGLAHYLPEEVVPNDPIAERIGVDDEWIVRRTGIRSRRRAAPDERLIDLAANAGAQALQDAHTDPEEIDLVLVASLSQDQLTPNAAPVVAHALGAHRAGALDLGAACSGWLSGLSLAAAQVEIGRADRALADVITASHEERLLRVEGHETFQTAVKRLSEATLEALERADLNLDDIDIFVYHQANARILRAVGERLDLEPEKVADYIAEVGNTSAASIPLTLALLREQGRLHAGQRVLVAAIGAGFTWGAGTIDWEIA